MITPEEFSLALLGGLADIRAGIWYAAAAIAVNAVVGLFRAYLSLKK